MPHNNNVRTPFTKVYKKDMNMQKGDVGYFLIEMW
jgi:hypothetical protein